MGGVGAVEEGCYGNTDHHHLQTAPLLASNFPSSDDEVLMIKPDDDTLHRTGSAWTAVAHIITGVIGSGVLTLAWSTAQLGWIGAPLSMMAFGCVTLLSALLLSDCYKYPDPDSGPGRNASYLDAVHMILGKRAGFLCGILVRINLCKVAVIYTIASASSIKAIYRSNCYHKQGHEADCKYATHTFMLVFGVLQVVVSQIPDFHSTELLSFVAAVMSFAYASIGSLLGLAIVLGQGEVKGSIGGMTRPSVAEKMWSICQGLGSMAFSFPFPYIFFEIQNTLRSPPDEKATMKKASTVSVGITTFFYLCCGGFGYAAFGNETPGNLLTGFGFYEPYWLIDFANACVVLHLVGGYQLFSQPLYAMAESWISDKVPQSGFVSKQYFLRILPWIPAFRLNLLRLCLRTAYVAAATGVAMMFPYFNEVIGIAGAINFWPSVVYFPVEMYLVQKNIAAWSRRWVFLRLFSLVCLFVSMFALLGSIKGLISAKFG